MVATSGSGWRLAPALVRLIDETDRLFPQRSQASDGSIGDTAHSARTSDHNPDDGWVDAVDITDDDAHGCDVALLAHHLVAKRDPRVGYLIHKGTIWRGYDKPGLPAFTPQPYTGPNAHEHHLHVSIDDDHRHDTAPWWPQAEPAPPPIAPAEDDAAMYFLKHTDDPAVWFFEQGRYTHVPSSTDGRALAKAAGIAYSVGEVSPTFFNRLAKGREKSL